ncbi:MAG: nucleotidyltransferase domain-containing protein [Candidatus Hydrogenedentes bacterium]|nr:nucleotidyltransferase domain-containing protein [Candidatus Hydrogenedentota bacterium]
MGVQIEIDKEKIAEFCRRHHIVKLSLFGSVTTDDFRDDSDVDVLVEYAEGHVPDFFTLFDQQDELAVLVARKVDLHTPASLSRYFRDEVLRNAAVQYAA